MPDGPQCGSKLLQVSSKGGGKTASRATPSELMTCPNGAVLTTASMTTAQYDAVATSVTQVYNSLDSACTASSCKRADFAGCVVRMAGHDFMDYKDGVGGANACTDMSHADNAGLSECLHTGEHGVHLDQAYTEHCTEVSLADFLVIAAEAIMTATRSQVTGTQPSFRDHFKYGRTTSTSCDDAAHLLPNPHNGCNAVGETFVSNMGLSWRQAAALMGVHSLGRAQISKSGFHGWWSDPVNSGIFNNDYYISLMAKGWRPETSVNGQAVKSQWGRSDQGQDNSFDGHEMMLDTDMCLAYTFGGEPVNSLEHNCCAWVTFQVGGATCGDKPACCGPRVADCGDVRNPDGPAADDVIEFGNDESVWLAVFQQAWTTATENGFNLTPLDVESPTPTETPTEQPTQHPGGRRRSPPPPPPPAPRPPQPPRPRGKR